MSHSCLEVFWAFPWEAVVSMAAAGSEPFHSDPSSCLHLPKRWHHHHSHPTHKEAMAGEEETCPRSHSLSIRATIA